MPCNAMMVCRDVSLTMHCCASRVQRYVMHGKMSVTVLLLMPTILYKTQRKILREMSDGVYKVMLQGRFCRGHDFSSMPVAHKMALTFRFALGTQAQQVRNMYKPPSRDDTLHQVLSTSCHQLTLRWHVLLSEACCHTAGGWFPVSNQLRPKRI